MSGSTNLDAVDSTKPAMTAIGTMTAMPVWTPMVSDTLPITGKSTAMPGIANTVIVENAAERTRGGETMKSSAKKAGTSGPIDAARTACTPTADRHVGSEGDEQDPIDHADDVDDGDESQENSGAWHGDSRSPIDRSSSSTLTGDRRRDR